MAFGPSWSGSPSSLPGSRVWRKLSEITGPNLAVITIAGEKSEGLCMGSGVLLSEKVSRAGGLEPREAGIFQEDLRHREGSWISPGRWFGVVSRTTKLEDTHFPLPAASLCAYRVGSHLKRESELQSLERFFGACRIVQSNQGLSLLVLHP